MAVQLFNLRGVPDDEAEDVRRLLREHGVDFYETPAGNWGISIPALWLNNEHQLERARALIDEYQARRCAAARAEHQRLRREGRQWRWSDEIRTHPVRVAVYSAIVIAVLYFSTKPFLDFGR